MVVSLAEISQAIAKMTREDILKVGEMTKLRWKYLESVEKLAFSVGDMVEFEDRYGETIQGTILKLLTKNIRLHTTEGATWTVSPGLLRKVR